MTGLLSYFLRVGYSTRRLLLRFLRDPSKGDTMLDFNSVSSTLMHIENLSNDADAC